MSLKNKVLTGLKWNALAKLFGQVLSWMSTILVIRLLSPDDYGLMSIAMIFTALCYVLSQMGFGTALVQAKETNERVMRQVFSLIVFSNTLLFVLLWSTAPFVAAYFEQPLLTDILRIQSFQYLIIMFYMTPHALLMRRMDYRSLSIIELISFFSNTLTTLFLAWNGYGVWSLVFGSMVEQVVKTILVNIVNPFFRFPTLNFTGFSKLAAYGGYTSLDYILWYIYSNSDRFVIGKLMNANLLGIYSVAMQLASIPLEKVGAVINQVALPAYAKIQDDMVRVSRYTLRVSTLVNLVSFPVFFGISATAPIFVPLLIGEKWFDVIVPLQLLSLLGPLRITNATLQPAVAGIGFPKVNVINLSIACIVMPVCFVVGAKWGLLGISYAWIVGFGLWYVFMIVRVMPVLEVNMQDFAMTYVGPLLAGVLMFAAVHFSGKILSNVELHMLPQLFIMVVVGAVIYGGVIWFFFRKQCTDAFSLIRR